MDNVILDERIEKRLLGSPRAVANRGGRFGVLRILWIGTIDNGDADSGGNGSLGHYHVQVWSNNSTTPTADEIIPGPGGNGWGHGDARQFQRGLPVFSWRNEDDSVKIGIYDSSPYNEEDYLFFGTVQRKQTVGSEGIVVGNKRFAATRQGIDVGSDRIARRISDEFAELVLHGTPVDEAKRRADQACNWPKHKLGLDYQWFGPGKFSFFVKDAPRLYVQFATADDGAEDDDRGDERSERSERSERGRGNDKKNRKD